jgi:hypothetical protein
MTTHTTLFTPEQREAWKTAKLLLKQLKEERSITRLRALHVAMSELRRERNPRKGPAETPAQNPGKREQREALDRQERLRERIEEWKLYFADPGARKLFIIVEGCLSASQKAVQASHAAAQFQKEHPLAPWVNGTMVLLTPDPSFKDWRGNSAGLSDYDKSWIPGGTFLTIWREPDMGNKITAVCILKEFKNSEIGQQKGLKLL